MADTKDKFDFSENPFVGPHPIETGRNIFGRNREIDDLYYLLSAERIVMLHSPSGAGKTSLIQAGLIPRLNERFDVWGPTRVNQLPSANSSATVNRYIRSAVLGLEQQVPADHRRSEDQLAKMTLVEYVSSRREESKNIVLIFDQFEEILTADPLAINAKQEFFKQLGELLLDPRVWALFAMREDYLPALDPYAEQVPTHLKNWFRLDLLRRDKATEAITETAKEGRRQFDTDAVTELVTDLATMKVQQPDGTFAPQKGLYVEPLQLQVVCRRLWERMPADKQTIDLAEIEQSGSVTTALADYYAAEVARLANGDVRVERKLREWIGEKLITSDGIRSQVLRGAGSSEGLDNELIANLVNTHLVRGEQREGATWYELAHDRLIEPIHNNNQKWFDEPEHKYWKLARQWNKQDRPDGLLILGADLIEARKWAEKNGISSDSTEGKFLKASAEKQGEIEKEARQAKRLRRLLAIMAALFLLAAIAAWVAFSYYRNADEQRKRAEASEADSRGLLYVANQLLAWNAFDQKQFLRVYDLLEASFPAPGSNPKEDTRSFDWYYLWRLMHHEKHTLKGHTSDVYSVAFSPDGRTLASSSDDKTLRLWDVSSGKELSTLEGHTAPVLSVAFSPNGHLLASGSEDKTIRLWEVTTGELVCKLEGHTSDVWSVVFSPDGRMLASGGEDEAMRLWDVASGKELRKLEGHEGSVRSVAFSPDGGKLASGGQDKAIRLWDVASGKELRKLKGHLMPVTSVAFALDGQSLASDSGDMTLRLWSVSSGKQFDKLEGQAGVVAFAPDGRTLANAGYEGTLRLWDLSSGKELRMLKGHAGSVSSLAFSLDGQTLATGSSDKTVRLWDVGHSKKLRKLEGHTDYVSSVAFSPDGQTLASGSDDKTLRLWDVASGKELRKLEGHADSVWSVAFSPDGRTLANGSREKTLRLWDIASGKELHKLEGHAGSVWSLAFSPDGQTLASGSDDKTLRLWNVGHRKELRKLEGHADSVSSVSFSPDGRMLASGSWDKTVRLWDVTSGKELRKLEGHADSVSSVSFSPDGLTLASGSRDGTVKLWDVASGKELHKLEGAGSVWSVAFSPDGRTLAGGDSSMLILWNVGSGKELSRLKNGSPDSVVFSPEGRLLVSAGGLIRPGGGGGFGEILFWRAATNDEVKRQCVRCGRKD